jgi:hypothetical protein
MLLFIVFDSLLFNIGIIGGIIVPCFEYTMDNLSLIASYFREF